MTPEKVMSEIKGTVYWSGCGAPFPDVAEVD